MECAREFDKGSYYRLACKEPTSPKCTYESDQCYGCPMLKSDFVNINNEDGLKLECIRSKDKSSIRAATMYVSILYQGRLIALTKSTQQATDGKLLGKTSDSPSCPGSTTKASKCVQVKDANERAAKKAAYFKKEFTDKGLLAHPCVGYLKEKYTRRGGLIIRRYIPIACAAPQLVKFVKAVAGTEFAADLGKMRRTEYGYYHVTTEAEKAAAEKKKKEEVRECLKKLYREYEERKDGVDEDDGSEDGDDDEKGGNSKDGEKEGDKRVPATADYEPSEEELEAVANVASAHPVASSTNSTNRSGRRLAFIPQPPRVPGRRIFYGFAISDDWITTFHNQRCLPEQRDDSSPIKCIAVLDMLKAASGYRQIQVEEAVCRINEHPIVPSDDNSTVIHVITVCSALRSSYKQRPTQWQLNTLKNLIQQEPEWFVASSSSGFD
ncbi:hypothetical protein DXG03_005446 [Asterophora parasitica]|uniref:Uncharacterized protein n=1 Tax=Asterophora parasitica TaxID=117018 RepID=A0A9P7K8P6_9AGAR|nr:hypothetical protein DXG03_005446 [Asterophora parasitica]